MGRIHCSDGRKERSHIAGQRLGRTGRHDPLRSSCYFQPAMCAFRSILLFSTALSTTLAHGQYDLDARLKKLEEQQAAIAEQQKALTAKMDSAKLAIIRRDLQKWGLPKL